MIPTTVLLVLALGAPTENSAPADSSVAAMEKRAETLVLHAPETVNARITTLEELRRRHDSGETVSLTALRSMGRTDTTSEEARLREVARIEELKDEIRLAEAIGREHGSETPRTPPSKATPVVATAVPADTEKTPARVPAIVPDVVGEPELRLADARYQAADYADALGIYEKAAASGENTWAILQRSRCLEHLGRHQDAREGYELLVRDHPDDHWVKAAKWSLRVLAITPGESSEEEDDR